MIHLDYRDNINVSVQRSASSRGKIKRQHMMIQTADNLTIMDLREDFEKECFVKLQKIEASPFHQKALFERIKICEQAVRVWIDKGGRLDEVFWHVVDGVEEVVEVEQAVKNNVSFDDLPF